MYEYQAYQAHLLKIDDLHRTAADERRARSVVRDRRLRKREEEAEGRVRRHRARWGKAA